MKDFGKNILLSISLLLFMAVVTDVAADEAEDIAAIKAALDKAIPTAKPSKISKTAMPGIYEAVFGTNILYISSDGKYLIQGDLYDLTTRTNLTEVTKREGVLAIINALDPASMIVFAPQETKHVVTVFTDVDCSFCRKMHNQMAEYNELGIEFRYLSYPRSGPNTPSYFKAVTAWCSEDRQDALTRMKQGEKLPQKECKNPVITHLAAGAAVGVSGTPTIILENGQMIPGYVEPKRLEQILESLPR